MREFKKKKGPSKSPSDNFFAPHVQTKLAVGKPGDKFENEADAMASKVVGNSNAPDVQKAAIPEEEAVQAKPLAQSISAVQKKELTDEEPAVAQKQAKEDEQPMQKAADPAAEQEEQPMQKAADPAAEQEEQPMQKAADPAAEQDEQPMQKAEDPAAEQEEVPLQKAAQEEEPPVQKKEEEQDKNVQTKLTGAPSAGKTSQKAAGGGASVESKLTASKGKGNPMQGAVKSEMEAGFGTGFNDVKIHTDSQAEQMSNEMGALAFTHGKDIYFNSGQYDPESPEGKTLLAHELTHTIQQEGAESTDTSSSESALENDADGATRGFIGRAVGGVASVGKKIMPKLRSGLRIAKCSNAARNKAKEEFMKKRNAGATGIPAAKPAIAQAAISLGNNATVMDSYQRYQDKEVGQGDLVWGFFYSRDNTLNGAVPKPRQLNSWADFNRLNTLQKSTLFQISRKTGEVVHNRYSQTTANLDLLKLAYNDWPTGQYAIHQSGSEEATNTCNVFVGNSLFNAGHGASRNGRFFSAGQVYAGGGGNFQEIDKAYTQPGDIVAYGPHVGVVVTVDPASETFITREGYITPKGSERSRDFGELLGIVKPEMKVMRRR